MKKDEQNRTFVQHQHGSLPSNENTNPKGHHMKTVATIATLALLSLSAQAGPNFYPRGAKYKLATTFHFTINGVPGGDCPAELRGRVMPNGKLRIVGFDSSCLTIGLLPRIATATAPGMGFLNMAVTYQSNPCSGGPNFTLSETGAFAMPTNHGYCTLSIDGQFTPAIKVVP